MALCRRWNRKMLEDAQLNGSKPDYHSLLSFPRLWFWFIADASKFTAYHISVWLSLMYNKQYDNSCSGITTYAGFFCIFYVHTFLKEIKLAFEITMHMFVSVHTHLHLCVCQFICTHLCTHAYMCKCMCICVCACVVCLHIYVCVYGVFYSQIIKCNWWSKN